MRELIESAQRHHWQALHDENRGTPRQVGSESVAHKQLRYRKLSTIFADRPSFSVHDLGAGIGELYDYLLEEFPDREIDYSGSDLLDAYIDAATARHPGVPFFHGNILENPPDGRYDFVVMSGIFHQPAGIKHDEWEHHVHLTLDGGFAIARLGLAFNIMSDQVDFRHPDLYYAPIDELLRWIMHRLSRHVVVDLASPLFEATILVYRPSLMAGRYPQPEFRRYLPREVSGDA